MGGHRDFIKNMISGAAQADVALLMVPADGNFTTAIQKGNHKAGEVQGQSRQHARLITLLGVKQLIIGVNKMDTDTAGPYAKARYDEVGGEKKFHINTLYDCLNDMCSPPGRNETAPMRMPVSGIYKIKGVGDVIAGRIEQGIVKRTRR